MTRGESVTFLKRYDDTIVQPSLTDLEAADADRYTKAEVDAAVAAAVDGAVTALPRVHWARVSAGGSVQAGSSGVTATSAGAGAYDVTFPEPVGDCAVHVTLSARAEGLALGFIALGYASEAYATVTDDSSAGNDGAVRVATFIQANATQPAIATITNLPFAVMATC